MRVLVLGVGKIGGWLSGLLSKGNEVAVYDFDLKKARMISGVRVLEKLEEIRCFNPELVVNSVSLNNTIAGFKSVDPFVSKTCVFVDVASIKAGLPEFYSSARRRFCSFHPMFGPTFGNLEKLVGETILLIKESDSDSKKFFKNAFKPTNAKLVELSFEEHDELMAYALTLPFALTLAFASCVEKGKVGGTTFKKHLEIAKGLLSEDDGILAEVLFNDYSQKPLEELILALEKLKKLSNEKNFEKAKVFFEKLRKKLREV